MYRKKFDLGEPEIPLKLSSPPKDKKQRKRSHGDQTEAGPVKKKRKRKKDEEARTDGEGSAKKKTKVRD